MKMEINYQNHKLLIDELATLKEIKGNNKTDNEDAQT